MNRVVYIVLLSVALAAAAGCQSRPNPSYYEAAHLVDIESRRRDEIGKAWNSERDADTAAALEASYRRQCKRVDRALDLRDAAERREFPDR